MVFITFGLTTAAAIGLILGLLNPCLVPIPFPATRSLAARIYGSLLLVGGVLFGLLTRESWLPKYTPTIAALVPSSLAPTLPKLAGILPMISKESPAPVALPSSAPANSRPLTPPPDPGPPPEGPTRFGPKSLAQSAAKLRAALSEQGLITEWEPQTGPLGQAIWVGKGHSLGVLAEADEDRLYRIQVTEDLGIALVEPGPLAQDTARLQLGVMGLVLAVVSPEPETLRQESDQTWQRLLIRLQETPSSKRFSETLTIAGASLRLTLTQQGKASAQLAGSFSDLDLLLDAES